MQGCITKRVSNGTTLINVMIVVAILSIVSFISIPSFSSSQKYKLDLAIQEIVLALRFARTEAMRTGSVYGIDIDRLSQQVTVYKADLSINPVGQEFIVYHPINKNLYDYNFVSDLNLSNIVFDNTNDPFAYTDSVIRKTLLFDSKGIPFWIDVAGGTSVQLQQASVDLSYGRYSQSVQIQPYTGRIIVQ